MERMSLCQSNEKERETSDDLHPLKGKGLTWTLLISKLRRDIVQTNHVSHVSLSVPCEEFSWISFERIWIRIGVGCIGK